MSKKKLFSKKTRKLAGKLFNQNEVQMLLSAVGSVLTYSALQFLQKKFPDVELGLDRKQREA